MFLVTIAVVAAVATLATGTWAFAVATVIAGAAAWQFRRCRHRGPLGLLPPSTNDTGAHVPARWFCDACGKTWPAAIERGHPPVRRFAGYDPVKARRATKRADDHARRQRALAVRRAGATAPRAPRAPRHAADVLAIRRFAK